LKLTNGILPKCQCMLSVFCHCLLCVSYFCLHRICMKVFFVSCPLMTSIFMLLSQKSLVCVQNIYVATTGDTLCVCVCVCVYACARACVQVCVHARCNIYVPTTEDTGVCVCTIFMLLSQVTLVCVCVCMCRIFMLLPQVTLVCAEYLCCYHGSHCCLCSTSADHITLLPCSCRLSAAVPVSLCNG